MRKETIITLSLVFIILGVAVFGAINYRKPEIINLLNLILIAGMMTATAVYAYFTEKMAEEMRAQRLSEARPYLLLRLNLEEKELLQWDDYESSRRPTEFQVIIHNAGKGPAINLWAALWHRGKTYFAGDSKGYLAPNEEWQAAISRLDTCIEETEGWLPQLSKVIKGNQAGIIAVEYQDIHKRKWASYLCLERHVDVEQCVMEGEQNIVELKPK